MRKGSGALAVVLASVLEVRKLVCAENYPMDVQQIQVSMPEE